MVIFQDCVLIFWIRKASNNFNGSVKEELNKAPIGVSFPSTQWECLNL